SSLCSHLEAASSASGPSNVAPQAKQCHLSSRAGRCSVMALLVRHRGHAPADQQTGHERADGGDDTEDRGLLLLGDVQAERDQEGQDGRDSGADGAYGDGGFTLHGGVLSLGVAGVVGHGRFGGRLGTLEPCLRMKAIVFAPATPSTYRPLRRWTVLTAAAVSEP